MRLGQLARKLALRPIEIVEFLSTQQIQIEEGSNTRLADEYVTLIMKQFAPGMIDEVEAELANEKDVENAQLIKDADQTVGQIPIEISVDPAVTAVEPKIDNETEPSLLTSQQLENDIDVIRAPKVELPGLKVVGKIDIPEPKKKELPANKSDSSEEDPLTSKETRKPRSDEKRYSQKRREERPRRNPIAAQREKEAMEAEQKRREAEKREKEKRTQNYLKKVKAFQPIKPARLVNEHVVEASAELNDVPKTWWGRFRKWLTT